MTELQVAINGILLGGLYLLMAQGLNLIFGVMRVVNFAHGIFIGISGLIVYSLFSDAHLNPFIGLPIVFIVMFAFGMVVQRLLIERVKGSGTQRELTTLLVTFGLSYILINVGQEHWGSNPVSIPYLQGSLQIGSLRFVTALVVSFFLAIFFSVLLYWWLGSTRSGKSIRATSQTEIGAEACGIDTRRARTIAFGLGSALAAAAGMLIILTQPIAPQTASNLTIICFVVIALGGLGNYLGAAIGALIVGLASEFASFHLGETWGEAVPYVFLILIMLLRPQGLPSLLPGRAKRAVTL